MDLKSIFLEGGGVENTCSRGRGADIYEIGVKKEGTTTIRGEPAI